MLTDEVRKFTDDDFRAAVRLLDCLDKNLDASLSALALSAKCASDSLKTLLACHEVLESLDYDLPAARQLLIVADSFREVLGLKATEETRGVGVKST